MSVEQCAVFPFGEFGRTPGQRGVLEGYELRKVWVDGAEVIVHPGEGGVVDAIGRDKEVFRVVALGSDELGDGVIVDEDLGAISYFR